MLGKPPPMGVVTGPFRPTPVRSMESISSLGMYSLYFSKASAPALVTSQSILTPAALSMRTVAPVSSRPIPSPGISVILCAMRLLRSGLCFPGLQPFFFGAQQLLQFRAELVDVLEIAVDGGKADIGDLVDQLQAFHDALADFRCGAFALRRIHHVLLHFVHNLFHPAHGDGALLAGAQYSGQDLLALKLFPASVFLHHHVGDFVDALVGGEALLAFQAFAAAANRFAFLAFARIDHLVVFEPAKRTFHCERVFPLRKPEPMIVTGGDSGSGGNPKPTAEAQRAQRHAGKTEDRPRICANERE